MKVPKILIISVDPISTKSATGITISNIFSKWNTNNLAIVYYSDLVDESDNFNFVYKIPKKCFVFDVFKLSFIIKSRSVNNNIPNGVSHSNLFSFKGYLRSFISSIFDFSPIFICRPLDTLIYSFKPDYIYSPLGSARTIKLVTKISNRFNIPIAPHFLDDWPLTLYSGDNNAYIFKLMFKKYFRKLLDKSKFGFCISEDMCSEYNSRYLLNFYPLVNCVKDNYFSDYEFHIDDEIIFTYSGGLHLERWKTLLLFSQALEKITFNNVNVLLNVYCPDNDRLAYATMFDIYRKTKFCSFVSSDEVLGIIKESTILLHVESFDEKFAHFIKFSLSTKLPQYLAAGKPILGLGPANLSSMKFITRTNSGINISSSSPDFVEKAIHDFICDRKSLHAFSQDAYNYSMKYCSTKNVTLNLFDIFNSYYA